MLQIYRFLGPKFLQNTKGMLATSSERDYYLFVLRMSLITGILLLLAGCGELTTPDSPDGPVLSPSETAQLPESQGIPASPSEGDLTQMIEPLPTPPNSNLQDLIEKAKVDLAQRLSLPITEIRLNEAVEVEWSDSSLDCPEPGMAYLQVITPGYRIMLEVNSQRYEYHANRDAYFVYCESPIPPILPEP